MALQVLTRHILLHRPTTAGTYLSCMAAPFATSYLSHFGFQSEPFSNAPVTRFYFESEQHQQALIRLGYALSSMKGLAVVMGDIGTGKTTLARRLLDALPDSEFEAALLVIIHSGVDASWLLRRIAMQLGVQEPADEKLALLSQLYQRLVQIYESGKKAVVLIDEAQMLATRELMEEFRGLLNLEVPERKLISFVFFGLPDIDTMMNLDPPLKQRVALKFRLEGMTVEGTTEYVDYRVKLAGVQKNMFSPLALRVIHRAANGTPRVINTLCDNLLLEAFLAKQSEVSGDLAEKVARQLGLFPEEPEAKTELVGVVPAASKTTMFTPGAKTVASASSAVRASAPTPAAKPRTSVPAATARPPSDADEASSLAGNTVTVAPIARSSPTAFADDVVVREPAAATRPATRAGDTKTNHTGVGDAVPPEPWLTTPAGGLLQDLEERRPNPHPTPKAAASKPLATVQLQRVAVTQPRQSVTEIVHHSAQDTEHLAQTVFASDPAPSAAEVQVGAPSARADTRPEIRQGDHKAVDASAAAGAVALPKSSVNLDEIDSLLASIRRN